jgi:hypothetical protein
MDKWILDPERTGPEVFERSKKKLVSIIAAETRRHQRQLDTGIPLDLDEVLGDLGKEAEAKDGNVSSKDAELDKIDQRLRELGEDPGEE